MGSLLRFPRASRGAARLGLDKQNALAELDAELRSIDHAMKTLADRKRIVLVAYREETRRIAANLQAAVLVGALLFLAAVPHHHHLASLPHFQHADHVGDRLLIGRR